MTDTFVDPQHFTQAVTQLGETHQVIAAETIRNAQGVKILEKGATISARLYERLMQHQLQVPLEDTVASANSVTGPSLRQSAEDLMRDVPFFSRMAPSEAERRLLVGAIEAIPLPHAIALQLTVARDIRPEVFSHLLRTALTCVWLARRPEVSRYDLSMAAAAGMLHDIGMLHVDPMLLQPYQTLDHRQRRQLYSHPLISVALVERHHQYPREVVRAIGEHQEYVDGSGYPRGLMQDALSPLGRVVALAQVVAAMFASSRNAPEMRLSVLLRMTTNLYERSLAHRLMALLKPQHDPVDSEATRLEDPLRLLHEVDRLLECLPATMAEDAQKVTSPPADRGAAGQEAQREADLQMALRHAERLRQGMARVGAAPEQLRLLGGEPMDESLRGELSLLTHEAVWQLRALARHARRRQRLGVEDEPQPAMREWLEAVDGIVAELSGVS